MLSPEILKSLTGFKKITVKCDKCNGKIIFETDYLTETQAKAQHKCRSAKLTAQCKGGKK